MPSAPEKDDYLDNLYKDVLESSVRDLLKLKPGLSRLEAIAEVEENLRKNNPWVPPKGCPINDLPNELLAHIFYIGTKVEEDESDDEYDDDSEEDIVDLKEGWETDDDDDILVDGDGVPLLVDYGDGTLDKIRAPPGSRVMKVNRRKTSEPPSSDPEEPSSDAGIDDEDDEEPPLFFPVLCSHVCQHWRDVALDTPSLWTTLHFQTVPMLERTSAFLERSKGLPLDISFDILAPDGWVDGSDDEEEDENGEGDAAAQPTAPILDTPPPPPASAGPDAQTTDSPTSEDEPLPFLSIDQIRSIMDLLIPHISRWKTFEALATRYESLHYILSRLSLPPADSSLSLPSGDTSLSAPILEAFLLYHYEDCEDYEAFQPVELSTRFLPFNGDAPNLKAVALWGVHLDWERSLSLLKGLEKLELAYHADDVRPNWKEFCSIIHESPELSNLSMCLSGPGGTSDDWILDPDASSIRPDLLELPALARLVLCDHPISYIEDLFPRLAMPELKDLELDYPSEDCSNFVDILSKPIPQAGTTSISGRSVLASLTILKLNGFPCNRQAQISLLSQLNNLQVIKLNVVDEVEEIFEKLMLLQKKPQAGGSSNEERVMYCPNLKSIVSSGVEGTRMKQFVEARAKGGAPLTHVTMSEEDFVDPKDEEWLTKRVQLDFFEPSESEDELTDDEDGDEEMSDEEEDE